MAFEIMAHQPGWIELYEILAAGDQPAAELVELCKSSRTSLGETMLHWYAIEGEPHVLERIIALGFDVNVQNDFGRTPLMECSQIGRWDNVRVLVEHGADPTLRDREGLDYFHFLREYGIIPPDWLRRMTVS